MFWKIWDATLKNWLNAMPQVTGEPYRSSNELAIANPKSLVDLFYPVTDLATWRSSGLSLPLTGTPQQF
jgi:hypothetical protein